MKILCINHQCKNDPTSNMQGVLPPLQFTAIAHSGMLRLSGDKLVKS